LEPPRWLTTATSPTWTTWVRPGEQGKKVVVIGGAGFLGGHVVDALEQIGAQTTIFDIRPVERRSPLTTSVVGDLCNYEVRPGRRVGSRGTRGSGR